MFSSVSGCVMIFYALHCVVKADDDTVLPSSVVTLV
jgi:hypothetical protein